MFGTRFSLGKKKSIWTKVSWSKTPSRDDLAMSKQGWLLRRGLQLVGQSRA